MTAGGKQKVTTIEVWEILIASHSGDLAKVRSLSEDCPGLLYAQYNYAPPIHFAVREGHTELVEYLLAQGAHDPDYRIYPFLDSLQTLATDRGYNEIAAMLDDYAEHGDVRFRGDNGAIDYRRTTLQKKFEKAVNQTRLADVRRILEEHPEFALDNTYFWSEGILLAPVKTGHFDMVDLLMSWCKGTRSA